MLSMRPSMEVTMDEKKLDEQRIEERREFLKRAGKAAITVPAVALLLSASKASAAPTPPTSLVGAG